MLAPCRSAVRTLIFTRTCFDFEPKTTSIVDLYSERASR